mmetsp:Transcript_6594/g.8622  ORF Transcript_6594/g.8622 Transcript_6594/m.8622 type:complete len:645 (+) Transcript_6594:338-2272(+)|eukprot:CAMPEP_0204871574 /NCGR_PEP_ID=MMETSP1348-20121228/35831_1 /ASSEMBLY_ACC=CAM_ASM_000700 /TAXON_ID=215587 /ORGANISM="Aplanochytrium stocchinoi, Strain GSBS06" /LENGTH=644 /DNA_ID=CAMNT_0052025959 /DNA_START=230 /DNA_END=2164 /DNA_ORIENTATION=-
MAQQLYVENYGTLINPASEAGARYQALVQILEGLDSSDTSSVIAKLAATNIGTFIDLLRKSSGRPDDKNIHANAFQIIWKLSQIKGYRDEYKAGGLPELCLELVKEERYRMKILEMLFYMLENSKLVNELVDLGVVDVLFKYAPILANDMTYIARPRNHVFHSLAIISAERKYSDVLLQKGVANLVKKYSLDITKEPALEGADEDQMKKDVNLVHRYGLDILFNISYLAEETGAGDAYKMVLDAFVKANVFDSIKNFCSNYAEQVALSAFKIIWRLSAKLHEATSTEYRAQLIQVCKVQGTSQPGHRRFCALTILTQMSKIQENLELIVNSGVFDMCATLGLEETGDMLGAVVKLLFVLSGTRFAAIEQAGRSDCPRVLVKILKDAKYQVPSGKNWDRATSSQALLTLINLALYGGNISDALQESGAVTVLYRLMHQKNVVGMVATMGLGYIFGGDDTTTDISDIPKIDQDVFDVILETLENSLEGRTSHGTIIWSVHEICLAFRCLSVSRHNTDVVGTSIPYLIKILYDFSEEYGECDEENINVETVENILATLVRLSYTKSHMITLIELGPSLEDLLEKIACLLEDEEGIARTIDTIMLSLQNEREITKVLETEGKIRQSARIKWDFANDPDRLKSFLKSFF